MPFAVRKMLAVLILGCLPCLISPVAARAAADYRVRVTNTLFGPVEISLDHGATWTMVGRVVKVATATTSDGAGTLPAVERSSRYGVAFGVGEKRLVRLVPDSVSVQRDRSAIGVNLAVTDSLFADFLLPTGTPVQQVLGKQTVPIPPGYVPHDDDVLLFSASRPDGDAAKLQAALQQATLNYQNQARLRAAGNGNQPTTGTLTVTATMAPGDSSSAVTFLMDFEVQAIVNRTPYQAKFDTRRLRNGEHVVEARAVDAGGHMLTRKKALVYVEN